MNTLHNNVNSKKKVTITATDSIGRTESVKLILPTKTAARLKIASTNTYPDGQPYSLLKSELSNMCDDCAMGYFKELSRSQFYRLRDFSNLIYHKFYNYTLSIDIE